MPKPKTLPKKRRQIRVDLSDEAMQRLRTVGGWMLNDPQESPVRLSHLAIMEYALRTLVELGPPASVRASGG